MQRAVTDDGTDVFMSKRSDGGYLSVSDEGQVGIYPSGTAFYEQQHGLISKYNGEPLSVKSNGELWCETGSNRLEVSFVPA